MCMLISYFQHTVHVIIEKCIFFYNEYRDLSKKSDCRSEVTLNLERDSRTDENPKYKTGKKILERHDISSNVNYQDSQPSKELNALNYLRYKRKMSESSTDKKPISDKVTSQY